ncbi:metallophosphoesterase [Massilia sp. Root335]|jgi:3',5'-cyclic AMP phosphodiesterase CpdA|uniref:metallophosphoesterase family protein n=1 Tax=Massilia sp. Root335 TaxID=1736517 RepID=UPI0006F483D0|nr:metallophosphoesterase [Massilia sp. Root335]KQV32744.1 alkaline phosphatase [Massilia sp. Root335]
MARLQMRAAAALAAFVSASALAAGVDPGITVYAAGDIARCAYPDPAYSVAAETAATVAAGLAQDPRAVVLALGDLTYPVGAAKEFSDCYAPTWGRFKDRTWPAPGNHEYYTPGAKPYFAYWGARAGRGYYSFELGTWHVISLDSNLAPAQHAAQLDWLRADLARHPARCTLAYWHHPLYSSGGHGSVPKMRDAWKLLYDAGAELVLSGHDHDYERFAPQDADGRLDAARGIRQFVVGTGGAYPTPFLLTVAHSEVRDSNRTGVLRLQLYAGGYGWEFVESTRLSSFGVAPPDRGSAACH